MGQHAQASLIQRKDDKKPQPEAKPGEREVQKKQLRGMSFDEGKQGKNAPLGTKPAFEIGVKLEGATLKELNVEGLEKFELPEEAKEALGTAGVEIGGKQSTTRLANKN